MEAEIGMKKKSLNLKSIIVISVLLLLFSNHYTYAEKKYDFTKYCFSGRPVNHVIFNDNTPLYEWELKALNLTIVEKVFNRDSVGDRVCDCRRDNFIKTLLSETCLMSTKYKFIIEI